MIIEDRIETPENVELRRKLAGIGLRFQAGLLDTLIIIFCFYLPIFLIVIFAQPTSFILDDSTLTTIAITFIIIFVFIIYWGYFLLFELYKNGQTPGKKLMKIRVVLEEGHGISFYAILIRNLLRVVDGIGVYSVGELSMFFSNKIQRLGDMAAGTVVISEQISDYSASADNKQRLFVDEKLATTVLNESTMSPEEFRLLSNYWARKDELDPEARRRILPKILKPILDRRGETLETDLVIEMESKISQLLTASQNSIDNIHSTKTMNE